MLRNYFISAVRNFAKHSTYFTLNVFGLTIGMASFILISLYIVNELSHDRFHPDYQNIYRVHTRGVLNGQEMDMAFASFPMGKALLDDYPEIEKVTQIRNEGSWVIGRGDKKFNEDRVLFTDTAFFQIFDFGVVAGDLQTALQKPKSLVLTESTAFKYFGDENPIGKNLSVEGDSTFFVVTAVVNDVPDHSHIDFDILGSISTYPRSWYNNNWISLNYYTYIKTNGQTKHKDLESRIQDIVLKYVGPQINGQIGITIDQWMKSGNSFGYYLMPLKDIYMKSKTAGEIRRGSDESYIYIYAAIALTILAIAIINFINLATAQSAARAKEVGIRKVVGSMKKNLIRQFIFESILVSVISMILACMVVEASLLSFAELVGKELIVGIVDSFTVAISLFFLSIIVGLLAGFYPAFVLASFEPVQVLKGILHQGTKSQFLRKFLVTTQFTASIVILVCTIVIYQQIQFMLNKNLGFDKEQILVLRRSDNLGGNIEIFKNELKNHPNIQEVAYSTTIPGKPHGNESYVLTEKPGLPYVFIENIVSFGYGEVYDLKMAEGRMFDQTNAADSSGYILNEAAVRVIQELDPIGKQFMGTNGDGSKNYFPIIGVVEDYNYRSLRNGIEPLVMRIMKGNQEGYVSIKLKNTQNIKETIDFVETKWSEYTSNKPFQYFFFDQDYERLYQSEGTTADILLVFSILSVCISCLGLIGLISYMTNIRRKEIGIRKVVGASGASLIQLLSSEFIRLTVVAMIVSWPLAYFVSKTWLSNFTDQLSIGIWPYLASTGLLIVIGGLAIAFQTIKAALSNPIDALRQD